MTEINPEDEPLNHGLVLALLAEEARLLSVSERLARLREYVASEPMIKSNAYGRVVAYDIECDEDDD